MKPTLNSHTHCQAAPANAQTQAWQRVWLPQRTVEERNNEGTTRYIKHLADSADFKGGTFNKHRNGLIGNRFEMPNVSYTHPLGTIKET